MARKNKSGGDEKSLKRILCATAVANLITALILLIRTLLNSS